MPTHGREKLPDARSVEEVRRYAVEQYRYETDTFQLICGLIVI